MMDGLMREGADSQARATHVKKRSILMVGVTTFCFKKSSIFGKQTSCSAGSINFRIWLAFILNPPLEKFIR
jgi:hypothetical protein